MREFAQLKYFTVVNCWLTDMSLPYQQDKLTTA